MKRNSTIVMATVFFLSVMSFVTGCKKPNETKVPVVTVLEQSVVVSYYTALLCAEVTDDGGALIKERGFCYGKVGGPIDTLLCEVGSSSFSIQLTGLSPLTAYTCQAFASNEAGRGYSEKFNFTTVSDTIPLVDTYIVKDVTQYSAVPSGQVLSGGGQEVMERGICYSTEPRPNIESPHVALGSGIGPFECQLTDLQPDTRYYICAYAVCTKGVYYGDQLVFDTKMLPMAVRTISVSDVTGSRVKAAGEVIRDGGYEVKECGFCWGVGHNPTIDGLHMKVDVRKCTFESYFSGLEKGQTHYVRAYAINEEGVAYGDELEFVPDDPFMPWPEGALPGLFSVGKYHQVRFSQGNLQYCADYNVWRFAEDQWDFVGGTSWDYELGDVNLGTVYKDGAKCDNTKVYYYYDGWIDLFGWGTSGWNNGNEYYHPCDRISYVPDCSSYGPRGNFGLTGEYAHADWGVHNTISNGGSRQWRTPSAEEFLFLLDERVTPSGMRFSMAVVAGVRGMILLPDDWDASTYPLGAVNVYASYFENKITAGEWLDVLEPAGAVFLPAAGERYQFPWYDGVWYDLYGAGFQYRGITYWQEHWYDPTLTSSSTSGSYWTASQFLGDEVAGVNNGFSLEIFSTDNYAIEGIAPTIRCNGRSVRLISDE